MSFAPRRIVSSSALALPSGFLVAALAMSLALVSMGCAAASDTPPGNGGTGGRSGTGGDSVSGSGGSSGGGNSGSGGSSGGGNSGSGGTSVGSGGGGPLGGTGMIVDPPCSNQVDNVAPSIDPPGGLAAGKVPMFVVLGFDDNGYADGINWVLDNLHSRKNADGTAARATFFISAGFASDFFNAAGGQSEADLINSWKRIKTDGHEIANHTWSHGETLMGADEATWQTEITKAHDLFVNTLGVEACKLGGFRTPFLGFTQATFDAIKATGIRYDASVEFGY
ncbi:MAG TPA: polysaccharide deacetylase family protein, partial [Polyangia bacterium]|nr:polysaccharide deacetylase family protein [Polyangia bacterium]